MKKHFLPFLILFVFINQLCHAQAQSQTPTLWGMANFAGTNNTGVIVNYSISNGPIVEYNFGGGTNGQYPYGSLTKASDTLLYGMTQAGGANGDGTIFSYNISSGVETNLHNFGSNSDGQQPYGSLLLVGDTVLYGMTNVGGADTGGIIFSYNITTGIETDLYNFGNGTDGKYPLGSLLLVNDSLLYGMTSEGGADSGGIIFSYNTNSGTETDVHDFGSGTDGANPHGSLITGNDSLLYGMTAYGGADTSGMNFSYNIYTGMETNLHDFTGDTDGSYPTGSLLLANDTLLYGMTEQGGAYSGGTIFSYNILNNRETILYALGDGYAPANPYGSLILVSDSLLYGMTKLGGAYSLGTIFNFNIVTPSLTIVDDFFGGNYGEYPYGDLIEVDSGVATGVKQLAVESGQLTVYPNPAADYFYVNLTQQQTQPVLLSLYNILGQEVWSTHTNSNSNPNSNLIATVPVTNLPNGVYILKATSGNIVQQKEVVVAR